MDWLDKLNIVAIAIFSLLTIGMVVNHEIEKSKQPKVNQVELAAKKAKYYSEKLAKEKEIYKEVLELKKQGSYTAAIAKVEEIKKANPGLSRSYVYLAEFYGSLGEMAQMIHNYRKAIEMEPDYIDKKTPLFIGKTIKKAVIEQKKVFERAIRTNRKDATIRTALKDVYYLQRRLAGGCE